MQREAGARATALLFAVALVAAATTGCGRSGRPAASPLPVASTGRATAPTPVAVHVTSQGNGKYTVVTQMKNRRTIYTIRALSFEGDTLTDAGTASGTFEQPHIVFRDRQGGGTVADAPKAVLTSADKTIVMTGGVQARTQDGNILHCDRLRYDGADETIHGEGHVRLETPSGLALAGDRIDGDVRLANVKVTHTR